MSPTLRPMAFSDRLAMLRETLHTGGEPLDAMLVTHLTNVRYLSGFTGSAATLVVSADEALLVTDGRYGDQAPKEISTAGVDIRVETAVGEQALALLCGALSGSVTGGSNAGGRVGFEADHMVVSEHERLTLSLDHVELVATSQRVEQLRIRKDPGELDRMRAAAAIVDRALAEVVESLDGSTEMEFSQRLDDAIRRGGASGNSFETIVASGPNGALPHARPWTRRIREGDAVVIDVGAVFDGYCSDMTRTIVVGEPTPELARVWAVVAEAQAAGVQAVSAGVAASDVDSACRAVIDAAGWGDRFTHGTGHGVGLDVHEAPRVAATSTATLASGHVVTVEPGVYLPGVGGVRIEDMVLVTDDGCEPFTLTPKTAPRA